MNNNNNNNNNNKNKFSFPHKFTEMCNGGRGLTWPDVGNP